MPRSPRFRIETLADLYRQLRYAPASTRVKQMRRAEEFAGEVEPQQVYPREYVVFRITGYRPESGDEPESYFGEALRSDLATFVSELSRRLMLSPKSVDRDPLELEEAAERLGVSMRTLHRYRRRGLICHYIADDQGGSRLICFSDSLQRFTESRRQLVEQAHSFTRIDESDREGMIDEARQLHDSQGVTLNEAALQIADRHNRAHETVRNILQRHEQMSPDPIFNEHGRLKERDIRLIERAHRLGVRIERLSTRFGKSATSIHRAVYRRRAEMLRDADVRSIDMAIFRRDDAEEVILGAEVVVSHHEQSSPSIGTMADALALLAWLGSQPEPDEGQLDALLVAYNMLKRRARSAIDSLPTWPTSRAIDRIETDLRWAVQIKRRLVLLAMPTVLRKVDLAVGRALRQEPAERIVAMLRLAVSVVAGVIESTDPTRDQHLLRLCAYAMDRRLAQSTSMRAGSRASARHGGRVVALHRLLAGITTWQSLVELPDSWPAALDRLPEDARRLIEERYGLGGEPPQTYEQLVEQWGGTVTHMSRKVREALIDLRRRIG